MPKIPEEVLRSPFYLYETVEDAKAGKPFGGTGFFVGYPTGMPDAVALLYAVTNWHVAVRDGASVIRINKIGGGFDVVDLDPSEWEFQPGGYDLAVARPPLLPIDGAIHEMVSISTDMFLDKDKLKQYRIGPGDDVFMVGRFVDHDGSDGNVPAVRFGNISVMPQKIRQETGATDLESFILDIHSRTGYSGSPVFVYRTHGSDLTTGGLNIAPNNHFIQLLGIHWGQFPEQWKIKEGAHSSSQAVVPLSGDAKYITGMSGMTMAIPAWAIKEFLEMPKFKKERDEALAKIAEVYGDSIPVAESAISPPSDQNPNHREDFSRLVNEAGRKRPPDGQT